LADRQDLPAEAEAQVTREESDLLQRLADSHADHEPA
jgi:hypothetical protein